MKQCFKFKSSLFWNYRKLEILSMTDHYKWIISVKRRRNKKFYHGHSKQSESVEK